MLYVTVFVCGILFVSFFLPLLQYVSEIAESAKEVYVSKCAVVVNSNSVKIAKQSAEVDNTSVRAIGFECYDTPSEFDGDEEEDSYAYQRKIGF